MRKLLILAALSATMFMFDTSSAFAGKRGGSKGCSGGGCGGGGCSSGYCGGGSCGGGYCGGGYAGHGSYCATCSAGSVGCSGGLCAVGGAAPVSLALNYSSEAPATLLVSLPNDATLTIDNTPTPASTEAVRAFRSPALEAGKEYEYTLTAKGVRDGKAVEVTRTVTVRAGEETRVQMDFPVRVASAK
jgi:uncharacterized protein (TIGR03000 family)